MLTTNLLRDLFANPASPSQNSHYNKHTKVLTHLPAKHPLHFTDLHCTPCHCTTQLKEEKNKKGKKHLQPTPLLISSHLICTHSSPRDEASSASSDVEGQPAPPSHSLHWFLGGHREITAPSPFRGPASKRTAVQSSRQLPATPNPATQQQHPKIISGGSSNQIRQRSKFPTSFPSLPPSHLPLPGQATVDLRASLPSSSTVFAQPKRPSSQPRQVLPTRTQDSGFPVVWPSISY